MSTETRPGTGSEPPVDGGNQPFNNRGERPYSPVQLLFLLRLARLLRQRSEYLNVVSVDDWRMRLLNKAIYSNYCDCLEQGISDDAKALFERDKKANQS